MDVLEQVTELAAFVGNKEMSFEEKYFRLYYWFFCMDNQTNFKAKDLYQITGEEIEIARNDETDSLDFLLFANRMFLLTIIMWADVNRLYDMMQYFYENE